MIAPTQNRAELPDTSIDVVVVNDYAHINGGAAKVAICSAIALASAGHKVRFLAAVAPIAPELAASNVQVTITGQHDIKSHPSRVGAAVQGIWNGAAARVAAGILSRCDRERTAVHVHGWTKALSSSVVRAALQRGFTVVVTVHDYFYACPSGGFFNFATNQQCHLQALSSKCILTNCDRDGYAEKLWRTARQQVQNRFGFLSGAVKHFICISDFSEQIVRPYLPQDAHVYRVPNPIDAEIADPVEVRHNTEFVAVGRFSAEKGFPLLARASSPLNCAVTFVGDGPMRAEIAALNPSARITGWQPSAAVREHLRRARALVFPSVWYEAQPLSILEAAALGIPAIVSDNCAGGEFVVDGVTGLWFRGGDVAHLRERLQQMQDPDLASRLGRAAYHRYWRMPFTIDRHVAGLQFCYQSALARDRAAVAVTGESLLPQETS